MIFITFFSKIQPEQEQRTFTISFLKYCLKGGNPQKLYKMNIGYTAANGKSTEMEMHQAVFPIYTYELENTFFSKTCTMRHKFGAKIVECPIRLAFIEELDEAQLDENFMKKFGNCQNIQLQKMYDTMTDNSRIQCKLITTSNKDPNMKLDKGLIRRTLIQKYESQFVSKNAVNESKNCYLMDTTWVETRFSQDSYKLAYFHFLLKEGHVQPEIIVPESNVQLVQDQVLENDDFLVKLNEHFVITKDEFHTVSQSVVRGIFESRDMPVRKINTDLKRLGVMPGKCKRVYRGIRRLTQDEINERESDAGLLIDDPE